jgi:hypothetical protein
MIKALFLLLIIPSYMKNCKTLTQYSEKNEGQFIEKSQLRHSKFGDINIETSKSTMFQQLFSTKDLST